MRDLREILHAAAKNTHDHAVLVTLFHARGSAYRKPGARMLILPGNRTLGTISGGCLEPEVARQAWSLTRAGKAAVLEFDSAPEDDPWGPASGCHGKLFLLAEPIAPNQQNPALQLISEIHQGDESAILSHEFHIHPDGTFSPLGLKVQRSGSDSVRKNGEVPASRWLQSGVRATFEELIRPRPHLLICGAGDDAIPLANIAAELGWRITITDYRARLATTARFPNSEVNANGPNALPAIIRQNTHAVVMSHRFGDDTAYLAELLRFNVPYVGLLGPRRRALRMLAELIEQQQLTPSPAQLATLHSPVGLDLGAEGAEAIALSIVAQIQALLAGRPALSLSQKVGPFDRARTEGPCLT